MQHLEFSCAVRRFFKSLGFKGLSKSNYNSWTSVSSPELPTPFAKQILKGLQEEIFEPQKNLILNVSN